MIVLIVVLNVLFSVIKNDYCDIVCGKREKEKESTSKLSLKKEIITN